MSNGDLSAKELRVVMDHYAQRWTPIARSTEPADFAKAERAAMVLYDGVEPPKLVLKMSSPLGALLGFQLASIALGTMCPHKGNTVRRFGDWPYRLHVSGPEKEIDRLLSAPSGGGWMLDHLLSAAGRRDLSQRMVAVLSRASRHLTDAWAMSDRRQRSSDRCNAQFARDLTRQIRSQLSGYSLPDSAVESVISRGPKSDGYVPNFPGILQGLAILQLGVEALRGSPFGRAASWSAHDLAQSCGGLVANTEVLAISDRPHVLKTDATGRLHCDDGPAASWRDGFALYYWRGIAVNERIIMKPDSITLNEIHRCENVEVRRVLIERYGEPRYIADSGMKPVASDPRFGDLFVEYRAGTTPLARIRVTNRTAEADGSYKSYWLSINPFLYDGAAGRIPQAAVASTWRTTRSGEKLFFKDYRDYRPGFES